MADMPIELYGLDVSTGAKLLLVYLWRYAGRDRFVWPSRETIEADLGISDRTLRRQLGELRDAAVLEENTEVRQGWFRSGWWLADDAAPHAPLPSAEAYDDASDASTSLDADVGVRPRPGPGPIWPPHRRERTTSTAVAANPGRLSSIEQPINQDSLSRSSAPEQPGRRYGDPDPRVESDLDRLRRWRVEGRDPEGLGPWPGPQLANGIRLPRLALSHNLRHRLTEGRTPEEIHRAVHLVAELVEAGTVAAANWRAAYVFSGWLDQLVIQALEHRARQSEHLSVATEATATDRAATDTARECSLAFMQSAMESSEALGPLAQRLREAAARPERPTSPRDASPSDHIERLELRSQVQAIAEELGCDVSVVLHELGRASLPDLPLEDKAKLGHAFITIRDGPVDDPRPTASTRAASSRPLASPPQPNPRSPHHVQTQAPTPATSDSLGPDARPDLADRGTGHPTPPAHGARGGAATSHHPQGHLRHDPTRLPGWCRPARAAGPRRRSEAPGLAGAPTRGVDPPQGRQSMTRVSMPTHEPARTVARAARYGNAIVGAGSSTVRCHGPRTAIAAGATSESEPKPPLIPRTIVHARPIRLRRASTQEDSCSASTTHGHMLTCLSENTAVSLTKGVQ